MVLVQLFTWKQNGFYIYIQILKEVVSSQNLAENRGVLIPCTCAYHHTNSRTRRNLPKHIINKVIIVLALRRSCLSSGLSIATQWFVFVDDNASLLLLLICLFLFQDSGMPRRSSTALVEINILDFGVIGWFLWIN